MDQLLTVKEAAKTLAVTEAAIRKWIYQRRLPVVKLGRLTRLRLVDVERVASAGLHPRQRPGH
jgi:excisionase family DNA binding protein